MKMLDTRKSEELKSSLKALITSDPPQHYISQLSNAASFLFHNYFSSVRQKTINWLGFYIVDPDNPEILTVGPFQGKPACVAIKFGKGACGTCAHSQKSILVHDVHTFPGHIACDSDSKSEMVVPILIDGKVFAVLDIDCVLLNGFYTEDLAFFEDVCGEILAGSLRLSTLNKAFPT